MVGREPTSTDSATEPAPRKYGQQGCGEIMTGVFYGKRMINRRPVSKRDTTSWGTRTDLESCFWPSYPRKHLMTSSFSCSSSTRLPLKISEMVSATWGRGCRWEGAQNKKSAHRQAGEQLRLHEGDELRELAAVGGAPLDHVLQQAVPQEAQPVQGPARCAKTMSHPRAPLTQYAQSVCSTEPKWAWKKTLNIKINSQLFGKKSPEPLTMVLHSLIQVTFGIAVWIIFSRYQAHPTCNGIGQPPERGTVKLGDFLSRGPKT